MFRELHCDPTIPFPLSSCFKCLTKCNRLIRAAGVTPLILLAAPSYRHTQNSTTSATIPYQTSLSTGYYSYIFVVRTFTAYVHFSYIIFICTSWPPLMLYCTFTHAVFNCSKYRQALSLLHFPRDRPGVLGTAMLPFYAHLSSVQGQYNRVSTTGKPWSILSYNVHHPDSHSHW